MGMDRKRGVVLLSGGIDSAVTLYLVKERGFECYCLIFDYGQRHRREIASAISIAKEADSPHKIITFSLPWGGSALIEADESIPKNREIGSSIPPTYVPGRNTIFLSFATSFAEAIDASSIFIGANHIDYSGYPDCRPAYIDAYNELIRLGTKAGVEGRSIEIEAPLIEKTKVEIIRLGRRLGVPFEKTWSCYEGKDLPCRRCDACILRAKGFDGAGIRDPLFDLVSPGGFEPPPSP